MSPSAAFGFDWLPAILIRKSSNRHSTIFSKFPCAADQSRDHCFAATSRRLCVRTSSIRDFFRRLAGLYFQKLPASPPFSFTKDNVGRNYRLKLKKTDSCFEIGEKLRLVFGYYEGKQLMYVARTRNGFRPASRKRLAEKFRGLEIPECPFVNLPEATSGRWGQ